VVHAQLGRKEILANAATLSRTPAKVVAPTPEIGEHTDEILRELEYSQQEIDKLRKGGVV
jgi:crotonobetainyl-CoA:carnitine CoA-transferase CaiB-like acyl-CoA transferase